MYMANAERVRITEDDIRVAVIETVSRLLEGIEDSERKQVVLERFERVKSGEVILG